MSTPENIYPKIKPLTAVNYQAWKDNVEFLLREKGLWKIVNGNKPKPPEPAALAAAPATVTPSSSATLPTITPNTPSIELIE